MVTELETSAPGSTQAREVRTALERILASAEFRTSPRACNFLRYVVQQTLAGTADNLKERTIGIEVFGRSASFEPSEYSTVRVKAGDVRRRLNLYYAQQGAADPVVIELPLGGYVPQFRYRDEAVCEAPGPAHEIQLSRPYPVRKRTRWLITIGILAVVAAGFLLGRSRRATVPEPLAQFWNPILRNAAPPLLLVVPVPMFSLQSPLSLEKATAKDFIEVRDQYVAVGDLKAESQIAEFLHNANRPAHIQVGKNVGFEDLRKGPAILIGFSYDRWKELNRDVRFSFNPDNETFLGISEYGRPTNWRIGFHPDDPRLDEDYAIVSRIFDRDTGQVLVQVSGISHYGTEGAADFITNSELLKQALRVAPTGWQQKNIQIVLHVRVISGAASAPKVVATYFW